MRQVRQQRVSGDELSRRAEAALGRIVGDECPLQRRERAGRGEPLDRRHRGSIAGVGERQARVHLLTVEQHGADATFAARAGHLGAGEGEAVAEQFEQGSGGRGVELMHAAVDDEAHAVK